MSDRPQSGQGRLLLEKGTLWNGLLATTERALKSGALQSIPTSFEFVEEAGLRFLVRVLSNLARKDEERWRREKEARRGREINPFLPHEEDLFVAELTKTHRCLLNKFNVVDHHLLIVTRRFEEQDHYLNVEDFAAMLAGLAEYHALAFYNGGTVAGASQRHKHLQLVPLPLAPGGPETPVEPAVERAVYDGPAGTTAAFPFLHAVAPLDPRWLLNPMESAADALATYHSLLRATGMERDDTPREERQSGPYNFIATRRWMLLVPRSKEFFDGASVNALGFAGALLVRSEEELKAVRQAGPLAVLREVARPLQPGP